VIAGRLLVIAGTTAAGKSELALAAALALGGEIISADSAAVYRGMDIGTGKPGPRERALVPHHCLDLRDPREPFSVAEYRQAAEASLHGCLERGRVPLLVGGSGLYIRRVLEVGPLPPAPPDPALRAELERLPAAELHAELSRVDAETAARLPPSDRRRVIRALEVHRATGRPLSAFLPPPGAPPPRRPCLLLVLDRPPEVLRQCIAARTDAMLAAGLVEETAALLRAGVPPSAQSMQALGYRQAVAHLRGGLPREALRAEIVAATTRFAKRQRTWFRREPGAVWIELGDRPAAAELPRVLERWRMGTGRALPGSARA
jgi:tRNA dimethylallyltransferase